MLELIHFESYDTSVPAILDAMDASGIFNRHQTILIKPNLVNDSPFPVTTSPDFVQAVITYLQSCTKARLIIGEGCGDNALETTQIFDRLGYTDLARKTGVELMDLNHEPLVTRHLEGAQVFQSIHLPEIVFDSFILSLPVLKAHSLAGITGTLKNMMGLAPPAHYSGGGMWKKSFFHEQMQQSISELCRHRSPDFTLMDASVGLSAYHLGGPECSPPVGKLLAADDPFEADQCAARLLGRTPQDISHIYPKFTDQGVLS